MAEDFLHPNDYLAWQGQTYQIVAFEGMKAEIRNLDTEACEKVSLSDLVTEAEGRAAAIFAPTLAALHKELSRRGPPEPTKEDRPPAYLLERARRIVRIYEKIEEELAKARGQAKLEGKPFRRVPAIEAALETLQTSQNASSSPGKSSKKADDEDKEPIHDKSSYYRYRALYEQYEGDEAQIAGALRRSDFNQLKATPIQFHLLDTVITFYKEKKPRKIYYIAKDLLKRTGKRWIDPHKCGKVIPDNLIKELLNDKLPMERILENPEKARLLSDPDQEVKLVSRGWFYQYYRWFINESDGGRAVYIARFGKEAWDQEHLIFDTFAANAATILQYVFADHLELPIFLVDKETRKVLAKIYLTVLIDAYSRSVLGFALLHKKPSVESIQQALRHAIWPKEAMLQALGIERPWIAFGIPQMLFLDNAWAHESHSLESLSRKISKGGKYQSIVLMLRPPYKGRYGALIERLFGNVSGQIRQDLPGSFVKSDMLSRRAAKDKACILYEDIVLYFYKLFVAYQHTEKEELGGMSPHDKWLEGLQAGYPRVPPLNRETERYFWREEPDTRQITEKGICAFGMHYWSPELDAAPKVGKDEAALEYHYAYQREDISRLAIFLDGVYICDVKAKERRLPDGSLEPLSLIAHEMAKKLGPFEEKRGRDELVHANEMQALAEERTTEQKRVQRSRSRHSEGHPSTTHLPMDEDEATVAPDATTQNPDDFTDLLAGFAKGARSERSIAPRKEE
jgi:hypothetical protein